MGLGESLVVLAAVWASVAASSLPGVRLCPGTDRRVFGPGRALRNKSQIRVLALSN